METAADTAVATVEKPSPLDDFDAVVAAYWPGVYRFALASLRDPDAAATVAQDCFLKAHRGRAHFRGDAGVRTWLMRIAINLVRDAARSRRFQFWKRAHEAEQDLNMVIDGSVSPEAGAAAKEQVRAVWRAVRHLPQRQRTVFLLRFSEEMQLTEIAAATGMAEGTVKVHLFRAVRAVREAVGQA